MAGCIADSWKWLVDLAARMRLWDGGADRLIAQFWSWRVLRSGPGRLSPDLS